MPRHTHTRIGSKADFAKCVKGKGKGKAISLPARTGRKDSRRLRLPNFKTIGK